MMVSNKQIAIVGVLLTAVILIGTMKFNWGLFQIAGCTVRAASVTPDAQYYSAHECDADKCQVQIYPADHDLQTHEDNAFIHKSTYERGQMMTGSPESYCGQVCKYAIIRYDCAASTTTTTTPSGAGVCLYGGVMRPVGWTHTKLEYTTAMVNYICQSDGTWDRVVIGCEWTKKGGDCAIYPQLAECKRLINVGGFVTDQTNGDTWECKPDGQFQFVSTQPIECKDSCVGNIIERCAKNPAGECQCIEATDCGALGKTCGVDAIGRVVCFGGTPTTTTTLITEAYCTARDMCYREVGSMGNAVCDPIGYEISDCVGDDSHQLTCLPDLTYHTKIIYGACVDVTDDCIAETALGQFNVVEECEQIYGCGIFGTVTDKMLSPIIKAFAGLIGYDFKSRCQMCSSLYLTCKLEMIDVEFVTCRHENPGLGVASCYTAKTWNSIMAYVDDFKMHYGQWLYWIFIVIVALIIIAVISSIMNIGIMSAVMGKLGR